MQSDRHHKHGFTLIELLVVISIVSLLMSILLPALSKARKTAQTTVCITQIKQSSLGNFAYATDEKGYAPWFGDPTSTGLAPVGTQRLTGTMLQDLTGTKRVYGTTMVDPAYWSAEILHCPLRDGYPQFPTRSWLSWDTSRYTKDGSSYTLDGGATNIVSSYWSNPFGDYASSATGGLSSPYWKTANSSASGRWAWRLDDSNSTSVMMWDLYLNTENTAWVNDHDALLIRSFLDGSAGSEPYGNPQLLVTVAAQDDAIRRICNTDGNEGIRRDNDVRPWQ